MTPKSISSFFDHPPTDVQPAAISLDFARRLRYDPRVRMQLKLIVASLLLTASRAVADSDAELSQKILGTWSERNHEVTFLQNGEWRLAKNGEATAGIFRWHIQGGYLIQFRDGTTFPAEKITWVTPNEFFLEDDRGGQSAPYYRHLGN